MLFYNLAPLQNDCLVMPQCMQFTFGDKGEVYLLDSIILNGRRTNKQVLLQMFLFIG